MKPVQTSVILCILLANACSIRANPIKDKFLQAIGYFYPEPSKGYVIFISPFFAVEMYLFVLRKTVRI